MRKSPLEARLAPKAAMEDVGRMCVSLAGPMLVAVALGIIVLISSSMYVLVFPTLGYGAAHYAWFTCIVFSIVFNYTFTIRRGPGQTPNLDDAASAALRLYYPSSHAMANFCSTCNGIKPPSAHHCRVCGRCILRMDHHCVWLGTCIGLHNYKHFFRFLVFCSVGTLYVACVTFRPHTLRFRGVAELQMTYTTPTDFWIGITFIASVAVCAGVSFLLAFHAMLVCRGMTTIEWLDSSPARHGGRRSRSMRENFRTAFGATGALWFVAWAVPTDVSPMPRDVIAYYSSTAKTSLAV